MPKNEYSMKKIIHKLLIWCRLYYASLWSLFNFVKDFTVIKKFIQTGKIVKNECYLGELYILGDGTRIGYRSISKFGRLTIDFSLGGKKYKFKFLQKK
jgi:hypothetical protein